MRKVCVATTEGIHFFGAYDFGCTHFFIFGGIMTVTFCGHSQYVGTGEDEEKILTLLSHHIGNSPAELFLGGYGAFDDFARKCGRKYQKEHPNVKLIFVTPYINKECEKDLYDEIIYPPIEDKPPKFAISYRNKWMIERADLVIAYIDHAWGGAYQTYKHAKLQKKQIYNLSEKEI